jgi:aspartyl-tRNA(Asn)/glutamyl-tRNA(Gln) amidotransferase subunit A
MNEMSALDRSIPEIASGVQSGALDPVALLEQSLERIRERASLNAFLTVSNEAAQRAASELRARRDKGEKLGPLAGVPIAIKDALCTLDAPTTCASKILTRASKDAVGGSSPEFGFRPPYDATVVARLRAAGAILVGKTNMDEFAMGSSGENS